MLALGKLHMEIIVWKVFTIKKDSSTRVKRCRTQKFATYRIGSNKSIEYWCVGQTAVRYLQSKLNHNSVHLNHVVLAYRNISN